MLLKLLLFFSLFCFSHSYNCNMLIENIQDIYEHSPYIVYADKQISSMNNKLARRKLNIDLKKYKYITKIMSLRIQMKQKAVEATALMAGLTPLEIEPMQCFDTNCDFIEHVKFITKQKTYFNKMEKRNIKLEKADRIVQEILNLSNQIKKNTLMLEETRRRTMSISIPEDIQHLYEKISMLMKHRKILKKLPKLKHRLDALTTDIYNMHIVKINEYEDVCSNDNLECVLRKNNLKKDEFCSLEVRHKLLDYLNQNEENAKAIQKQCFCSHIRCAKIDKDQCNTNGGTFKEKKWYKNDSSGCCDKCNNCSNCNHEKPVACCKAYNVNCLSCVENIDENKFCKRYMQKYPELCINWCFKSNNIKHCKNDDTMLFLSHIKTWQECKESCQNKCKSWHYKEGKCYLDTKRLCSPEICGTVHSDHLCYTFKNDIQYKCIYQRRRLLQDQLTTLNSQLEQFDETYRTKKLIIEGQCNVDIMNIENYIDRIKNSKEKLKILKQNQILLNRMENELKNIFKTMEQIKMSKESMKSNHKEIKKQGDLLFNLLKLPTGPVASETLEISLPDRPGYERLKSRRLKTLDDDSHYNLINCKKSREECMIDYLNGKLETATIIRRNYEREIDTNEKIDAFNEKLKEVVSLILKL